MSDHGAEYDSAAIAVITASVALQDAAAAPLSQLPVPLGQAPKNCDGLA